MFKAIFTDTTFKANLGYKKHQVKRKGAGLLETVEKKVKEGFRDKNGDSLGPPVPGGEGKAGRVLVGTSLSQLRGRRSNSCLSKAAGSAFFSLTR